MKQKLIKMQVKYEGGKRLLYFKNGGGIANTLICHAEVNGMNRNAILVICDETDTKYSEHSLVDKET